MPRLFRVLTVAIVTLCAAAFVAPVSLASIPALAKNSCPVLYRGSQQACYVHPDALAIKQAQQQMPVRVVDPVATVRRFTSLPLASVIVDRTRRDTGVLHPWIINFVFGHAPNLGLPTSTVSRSARFLVIGESVGRITLRLTGAEMYDQPRFERIRVNGRGRAIWTASVNLPHRNAALGSLSTWPQPKLERLITALMRRSA
jgi:hypothetical protein